MSVKRIILAATAALTLGSWAGAVPAGAQPYGDDDDYRPRRYERRYDYDRRRDDDDDDRFERRRGPRFGGPRGSVCVTARGTCVTRPAPFNSACGCEVPGFGFKRGQIGG